MGDYLYHGSIKSGLTSLKPLDGGYDKPYVYAVSDPAFAAIFINRPGGSLVASWGKFSDIDVPYYCELTDAVLTSNYKGIAGSIYLLPAQTFRHEPFLWKYESISEVEVAVSKEIVIPDLYDYLKELEETGKIKIIPYAKRLDVFPDIDEKMINNIKKLVSKYGLEHERAKLEKYQPRLFKLLSNELIEIDAGRVDNQITKL